MLLTSSQSYFLLLPPTWTSPSWNLISHVIEAFSNSFDCPEEDRKDFTLLVKFTQKLSESDCAENPSCCYLKGCHIRSCYSTSVIYTQTSVTSWHVTRDQLMSAASTMSYPSYSINPQAVTMFNMSTLLNQKDSRWLQLEVRHASDVCGCLWMLYI